MITVEIPLLTLRAALKVLEESESEVARGARIVLTSLILPGEHLQDAILRIAEDRL